MITNRYINGVLVESIDDGQPAPVVRTRYSKLGLVRALEARGLGDAFEQAIDNNGPLRRAWYAAVQIWSDDPLVSDAIPAFAASLGVSLNDVAALLQEAIAE